MLYAAYITQVRGSASNLTPSDINFLHLSLTRVPVWLQYTSNARPTLPTQSLIYWNDVPN
jgi:hypothetical protein